MSEQIEAPGAGPLPRRFLANINFVFLCALTSNTVGFFVAILLARSLGPGGRGEAALYQGAINIGFAFLNLGVGPATLFFIARREYGPRSAMETGLSVAALSAAAAVVAVLIVRFAFDAGLEGKGIPYGLAVLTLPAVIQLRVLESLLRGQGRFGAMNVLELALPLSMIACLGGVELAAGLTVARAVWAWSLAFVPPLLIGYALVGTAAWPRRLASISLILKTVRFGGQAQLANLVQLLNYRLDIFMILLLINTSGVGLYTVASSQTEGLWIVSNSVAVVLLTNITAGDAANAARMTPVVCRNTLLVTAVGAIVAAIIAGLWIPVVFGADYNESVLPYLLLLPGAVAIGGARILSSYVFSRGRPMLNTWVSVATFLLMLPVEIALILLFGVPGAAAGTSLGYCLSLMLTAIVYRHLSGQPILEALVPRRQDVSIYTGALRDVLQRLRGRHGRPLGTTPEA